MYLDVIVLDVRPEEEFRRGHIHKAVSIPIDQLSERLKELPKFAILLFAGVVAPMA